MIEARDPYLYALIGTLTALLGAVGEWFRRAHNTKINGLGRRVNELTRDVNSNTKAVQSLEIFRGQSEQDRSQIWKAVGKQEAEVESMRKSQTDQQAEIMEAIRASSEAQMRASHAVELQVATLAAKSDVALVLSEQLGKIAAIMERRERGENL